MAKHYAEFITVGSEEHIIAFYSSALIPIDPAWKLIADNQERNPPSDVTIETGAIGKKYYKYKITGSSPVWTKTARLETDIKETYTWMNDHRLWLTKKINNEVRALAEDHFQTLTVKENRGETLDSTDVNAINDFITDSDVKKDTEFHDITEINDYSRLSMNLDPGEVYIKVKRFPADWAVNDIIRIVDYGKNPQDITVTITVIDAGINRLDFVDPVISVKFKKLTSFAYRVG